MVEYIRYDESSKTFFTDGADMKHEHAIGCIGEILINLLEFDLKEFEANRKTAAGYLDNSESSADTVGLKLLSTYASGHLFHHPYLLYMDSDRFSTLLDDKDARYNLYKMALDLKQAVDFCISLDFREDLNPLTTTQRYFLFSAVYPKNIFTSYHPLTVRFSLDDSIAFDELRGILFNDNSGIISAPCHDSVIQTLKSCELTAHYLHNFAIPFDFAYYEFTKMIELNTRVNVCKNCGKYFLSKGNYATNYCDRIPLGEKVTCKRIAAIQTRKSALRDNPILCEFERAYKRNYSRVSNKRMTNDEFFTWKEQATTERDLLIKKYRDHLPDDILISFKKFLGNK